MMDREIDLLEWLLIPVRRWRLVLATFLALLAVGALIALILPPRYQAEAGVAQTADDRLLGNDRRNRLGTINGLITDASLTQAVIDGLGDTLPPGLRTIPALQERVSASALRSAETIRIVMVHRDPAVAAAVVNAYAHELVLRGNRLYAEARSEDLAQVQAAATDAQARYQAAQTQLEAQLLASPVEALQHEEQELDGLLRSVSQGRLGSAQRAVEALQRTIELQRAAEGLRRMVSAAGNDGATGNAQAVALLKLQAFALLPSSQPGAAAAPALPATRDMGRLPTDLLTLPAGTSADAVASAAAAAATTALTMTVQAPQLPAAPPVTVLSVAPVAGVQLQLQPALADSVAPAALLTDLDALIASLDAERLALEGQLAARVSEQASSAVTSALETRLRQAQADLARERAQLEVARAQRDLAWQTYHTVATEAARWEAALRVMPATGEMVRLASTASPQLPDSRQRVQIAAALGLAGLLLGCALAWGRDLHQRRLSAQ